MSEDNRRAINEDDTQVEHNTTNFIRVSRIYNLHNLLHKYHSYIAVMHKPKTALLEQPYPDATPRRCLDLRAPSATNIQHNSSNLRASNLWKLFMNHTT